MKAPWAGEKVGYFIRGLAMLFILCAVYVCYLLLVNFPELVWESLPHHPVKILNMFTSPYIFLLFLRVAVTGHAPKSWVPWK